MARAAQAISKGSRSEVDVDPGDSLLIGTALEADEGKGQEVAHVVVVAREALTCGGAARTKS